MCTIPATILHDTTPAVAGQEVFVYIVDYERGT
ncbi:hypothetical protein MNBD_BACTEROID01-1896 [hydrothermal vent metagenome]|uniref:Uncharacterized protein n=1 Tax=hydrothermal vent metagenome TaxID=652676 RepID=A0A3B0UBD5_9ZZZZ